MPRLLLVDGHSLAYRAFYALPAENFSTSTGQTTNAVYGFTSMLINVLRDEQPTHLAVAFDVSRQTFRTQEYSEYKANRSTTPEEFTGQVGLIREVLDALAVRAVEAEGYEADDVIATLTAAARRDGVEVLVVSGDRDAFQLVGDDVTVLYPVRGVSELSRMTPAAVEDRYGVGPELYPDLAALVGESSDNLPGVPGVGPKTAAKWLRAHGGLDGLLGSVEAIKGKAGESLRAHLDDVRRNRRLNGLVADLPLGVEVDDLAWGAWDRDAVHRVFDGLEFRVLRDRLFATLEADEPEAVEGYDDVAVTRLGPGEVPQEWLAERAGRRVGAALVVGPAGSPAGTSTTGSGATGVPATSPAPSPAPVTAPLPGEGAPVEGLAVADGGEVTVLAVADAVAWLRGGDAPALVMHDAKPQLHALCRAADLPVEALPVGIPAGDTALAAYLCRPDQRSYDLADLAVRHLGRDLDAGAEAAAAGQAPSDQLTLGLDESASEEAADPEAAEAAARERRDAAAARRALAVAELDAILLGELEQREGSALLTDLELPLVRVLARMEATGIAVDEPHLAQLRDHYDGRVSEAARLAFDIIGEEVNLGSPKQLQRVLFEDLDMPKTKRTKTGWTTDAEALADLYAKTEHPFLLHLLEHRDAIRLRQTVEGLLAAVARDGRIHTTFQQTIAATGRLSSADPNLQNIPIRTEEGRRIRGGFVVGSDADGELASLVSADYSQIEMRIMAHLSGDAGLVEAFRSGEDLHRFVGSRVFAVAPADVTPEMRAKVKAMSYGLAYGLSAFGLSRQLTIGVEEAQGLMDEYFERFGGVRDYLRGVVEQARRDGWTATILGRRRYLPDLTSDNRTRREMAERMALNAPIQGSAADLVKVAMLGVQADLDERGLRSRMLLQVHDELVLEVAEGELEEVSDAVRARMAGAAELAVPLEVSIGVGRSWFDAAH